MTGRRQHFRSEMRPPEVRRRGRSRLRAGLFLLAAAALLASAGVALAQPRLELEVDPPGIAPGGRAMLTVTVAGASRVDEAPVVAHPPEVAVQAAGQSTNISIVNGRMSRSIAFTFLVTADRPGRYTLGPAELRDGSNLRRSGTVVFTVAEGGAGVPPGGRGRRAAPGSGGAAPPDRGDAGDGGEAIFVRAIVDRNHAVVGEQVTLRFCLYRRADVPVLKVEVGSLPSSEGFWREDLGPERSSEATIDGHPYEVSELAYALFPTQSGMLEIGPGEINCVIQERSRSRDPFDFFGMFPTQRQVRLRSRPVVVRVDPLPEPKPADFTGGVGRFRLDARVEPQEVAQNEPVTLVLTVEGVGNAATIGDPELPAIPGVRAYPSGSEAQVRPEGDQLRGSKVFRVMLVPENTGRREVPPLHLSVFDPAERRYERLTTPALAFQVTPAVAGAAGAGGEVARVGRDLRAIRDRTDFTAVGAGAPWRSRGYWALHAIPLAAIMAGLAWRYRSTRREAEWGAVLSRGAPGRLQRGLEQIAPQDPGGLPRAYDELNTALERYLTDRFQLPVRGMTREELAARLTARGAGAEGIAEACALLDRCDRARYAPGTQSLSDLQELVAAARSLPASLERRGGRSGPGAGKGGPARPGGTSSGLLLLWLPLALAGGSLAVATAARSAPAISVEASAAALARGNDAYRAGEFAAALQAYGEIVRGGRESPDLYLNLGNAAYRLGRLGWAVYCYERGLRLRPRDPDLRANLDLALQETKDRIPEAGGSRFLSRLAGLQEGASLGQAMWWLLGSWSLFTLWLAARIAFGIEPADGAGRARGWRRAGRLAGPVLGGVLAMAVALTALLAGQAASAPDAVVVAEELPVRTNPESEATVEFTLHAGTRVDLGRTVGEYREILFSDKLRGWGETDGLAELGVAGTVPLPPEAAAETR